MKVKHNIYNNFENVKKRYGKRAKKVSTEREGARETNTHIDRQTE